jgi:hypothetical protein
MWYTTSAFVGVHYSVNLQIARCNNKDNPVYGFFEVLLKILKTVREGHRQSDDI